MTLPSRAGLRLKLNLVVLAIVLVTMAVFVWLDYRHEVSAVMAVHGFHAGAVGDAARTGPVPALISPTAVARRALLIHAAHGALTVVVLMVGINAGLAWLVLRPLHRIRRAIELMERGHWRLPALPSRPDEVGRVMASFQELGVTLDALVAHALHAERLATLALVSKRVGSRIEPEVEQIARTISGLHWVTDESVRDAAHEVLAAAARIMAASRSLDHVFELGQRRKGRVGLAPSAPVTTGGGVADGSDAHVRVPGTLADYAE